MEIRIFDSALEKFIRSLEKQTVAKALRTIDLLETFGPQLGMPHVRKITNRLYELRVRGRQEVRIFYTFHKNFTILLHGFLKKSEKTPQKEMRIALQRMQGLDSI